MISPKLDVFRLRAIAPTQADLLAIAVIVDRLHTDAKCQPNLLDIRAVPNSHLAIRRGRYVVTDTYDVVQQPNLAVDRAGEQGDEQGGERASGCWEPGGTASGPTVDKTPTKSNAYVLGVLGQQPESVIARIEHATELRHRDRLLDLGALFRRRGRRQLHRAVQNRAWATAKTTGSIHRCILFLSGNVGKGARVSFT